jgi:Flp pilus assembly protein TadD
LTAEHLLPFVPLAARIDQESDQRLALLACDLASWSSVHNAATQLLTADDEWDFSIVRYRGLARLAYTFLPYHPPQTSTVTQSDFEIYRGVMSMSLKFADLQLGKLLELAGEGTGVMIVSPSGLHSDGGRAQVRTDRNMNWNWHRSPGILIAAGPHIQRDQWVWDASILDIVPTVLRYFGFATGQTFNGKPLESIFNRSLPTTVKQAWLEASPAPAASAMLNAEQQHNLLTARIAHGDLDPCVIDGPLGVENIRCREEYLLALIELDANHLQAAAERLEVLAKNFPHDWRFAFHLGRCQHQLGNSEQARHLLEKVIELDGAKNFSQSLLGQMELADGNLNKALVHLFQAEQSNPDVPHLHCKIGEVYLKMERYSDAESAFHRAADLDQQSAAAQYGLGRALFGLERFPESCDALLNSLQISFEQPHAHFILGVALAHQGMGEQAVAALKTSLAQRSQHADTHRYLSEVYRQLLHDTSQADLHQQKADKLGSDR